MFCKEIIFTSTLKTFETIPCGWLLWHVLHPYLKCSKLSSPVGAQDEEGEDGRR